MCLKLEYNICYLSLFIIALITANIKMSKLHFMFCFFVGGSLFLFDRKALRYFRKDGHNWRKKKDGKTVREAHERLKVSRLSKTCC